MMHLPEVDLERLVKSACLLVITLILAAFGLGAAVGATLSYWLK